MWVCTGGESCTFRGGTLSGLGKKNAEAEEAMDPAQSIARTALIRPLPMKEAFPIGGLLSFLASEPCGGNSERIEPTGQLANSSLIQKKRELQY
jgi:hypothetical protein